MDGKTINSASELLREYEMVTCRQEYDVLVCFKIVRRLVDCLCEIEFKYNLYPYLWDVFRDIRGSYTDREIRLKKKWRDLIK